MKKLAYSIAVLLAACACSKEDIVETLNPVTFKAIIEDSDGATDTKTAIGEWEVYKYFPINWCERDSISVLDINSDWANSKFILNSGSGSNEAEFSGPAVAPSNGYFALYPYNKKNSLSVSGFITETYLYWDGQEQVAHQGSWDPTKAAMVAYGQEENGNVTLNFKNICSYIKITTDYACKSITFESNNSSDVISCTGMRLAINDDDEFFINSMDETSNKVVLNADDSGVIKPGTYYIATLPCELSEGFTLTFQSAKNVSKTCTRPTSKDVNLQRSHILNLGTLDISNDIIAFAGSGTESDPYQVSDLQELKLVATNTNKGEKGYENPYYIQTADIDCNNEKLTPIGNVTYMFAGKYDGGGHKISNAIYTHFSSDGRDAAGLFGNIYNATIKNLSVENCRPEDYGEENNTALIFGLIAAHAYSSNSYPCTITNCSASGTVKYNAENVGCGAYQAGGIIGASNANMEISLCTNNADFNDFIIESLDDASMGGILGYAGPVKNKPSNSPDADASVKIDRCRNNGRLVYDEKGNGEPSIGGIVGRAYDAALHDTAVQISNCVNTGYVGELNWDHSADVGGIFGQNDSDGTSSLRSYIFNCLNTGTIIRYAINGSCGGIIGHNYNSFTLPTTISMCVHAGHISIESASDVSAPEVGAINGTEYGTHHHIFNSDTNTIPLCFNKDDSSFTDGSGYYESISIETLNQYLKDNYSDKDAAAWKYVGSSNVLDLDF